MCGTGSLVEVQYQWTIDDLFDAHEALDIKSEMEEHLARAPRESR